MWRGEFGVHQVRIGVKEKRIVGVYVLGKHPRDIQSVDSVLQ